MVFSREIMATDEARSRSITKLAFKAPEEMVDDVRTQVTYLPDRLFEPHYAYKKALLAPNICALSLLCYYCTVSSLRISIIRVKPFGQVPLRLQHPCSRDLPTQCVWARYTT